jgi:phosphoribosyl 1,2-cyclic phosphodiesterase
VIVRLWGTRGSLATPGAETALFGGNTACVEVRGRDGTLLVLDAGTGIRLLGAELKERAPRRIHVLLTHLHMDHIQGLGFFEELFNPEIETHLWGPGHAGQKLRDRLARYLSPPLFPVHLRELPNVTLREVPRGSFRVGEFWVLADRICHPGLTVGYRVEGDTGTLAYLPDHEPALGVPHFPLRADWTSGYLLARGADLLVHDAQYSLAEYPVHVGWGHSALEHALAFARLADVGHLVTFHHDPGHSDDDIIRMTANAMAFARPSFEVTSGAEGAVFEVGGAV